MNPYLLLAILIGWGVSVAGAGWYGIGIGRDGEIAKQSAVNSAVQETREAAQQGAADAIAKIKITHTTVRARTETIVRDNPVYRDCVNDAGVMRNINTALTGRADPAGGVVVPAADGAKRP